jgi:hypothetical protein
MRGHKHTPENLKKLIRICQQNALKRKGIKLTLAQIAKQPRMGMKGRHHSKATRLLIASKREGTHASAATKERMRLSHLKRPPYGT